MEYKKISELPDLPSAYIEQSQFYSPNDPSYSYKISGSEIKAYMQSQLPAVTTDSILSNSYAFECSAILNSLTNNGRDNIPASLIEFSDPNVSFYVFSETQMTDSAAYVLTSYQNDGGWKLRIGGYPFIEKYVNSKMSSRNYTMSIEPKNDYLFVMVYGTGGKSMIPIVGFMNGGTTLDASDNLVENTTGDGGKKFMIKYGSMSATPYSLKWQQRMMFVVSPNQDIILFSDRISSRLYNKDNIHIQNGNSTTKLENIRILIDDDQNTEQLANILISRISQADYETLFPYIGLTTSYIVPGRSEPAVSLINRFTYHGVHFYPEWMNTWIPYVYVHLGNNIVAYPGYSGLDNTLIYSVPPQYNIYDGTPYYNTSSGQIGNNQPQYGLSPNVPKVLDSEGVVSNGYRFLPVAPEN